MSCVFDAPVGIPPAFSAFRNRFFVEALDHASVLLNGINNSECCIRFTKVTQLEQNRHLAVRRQRAEQIIVEVERFKVCDQCRSISFRHVAACSVCGAYRFIEEPEAVRQTATEMGANPFPVTSGIVPRI